MISSSDLPRQLENPRIAGAYALLALLLLVAAFYRLLVVGALKALVAPSWKARQ
ncbi:hypothetical protein [Eleftheria terrae]|uniref:hypothetical protein n=1 Tax=Eleftheria terrae TaxID=1597781 RepID=UPI00263B1379|nr:hypothetical protein [Eleftheria terrae]WKB55817.1 hypothetical protein N7L95_27440 [Eleftheria terrae]